jgi:hypothetical protein
LRLHQPTLHLDALEGLLDYHKLLLRLLGQEGKVLANCCGQGGTHLPNGRKPSLSRGRLRPSPPPGCSRDRLARRKRKLGTLRTYLSINCLFL